MNFHDLRAESLTRWSKKVDTMTLVKISGDEVVILSESEIYGVIE